MEIKEYTHILIKDKIITIKEGFECIKKINKELKYNKKYRIEYIMIHNENKVLCALFMFHGPIKVGSVFPYGYFRNSNSQS